jgi:glycosyltransferase involved in cell wall biosynthesis
MGIPSTSVTVIHNGVPACDPAPTPSPQGRLKIAIVGQIAPWKGHEDLLDALATFPATESPDLRIYGDGNATFIAHLRRRVSQLGLVDRVEWRGVVERQTEIYRDLDVCVQPSRFDEPFGMSTLESGAFGRPAIVSSRGGLPEIVENGVTGFVVGAGRPNEFAKAIRRFVSERSLVKSMGEAAYQHVHSKFSLAQCVQQFVQLLGDLDPSSNDKSKVIQRM